jgi:folate-binding protein YgfZ
MDDFKVENMAGTHGTILFYGEDIDKYVREVLGLDYDTLTTENFEVLQPHGRDSIIHSNNDAFGGLILIYAMEDEKYYFNKLFDEKPVEKFAIRETDERGYETKRILSGIPKFGNELNEQTNPLECGLENVVSFTKGCYIGQEVISRLDTYDKVSKHMIGIKFDYRLNSKLALQTKITLDDKECGFVSSYIYSENYGSIGLALVRTPFLDYGKNYKIKLNELLIDCKLIKLPFVN